MQIGDEAAADAHHAANQRNEQRLGGSVDLDVAARPGWAGRRCATADALV